MSLDRHPANYDELNRVFTVRPGVMARGWTASNAS
jgi:hypothetical protein